MKRKPKTPDDILFKDAPEHLKSFQRTARKELRNAKRAEYAKEKGIK